MSYVLGLNLSHDRAACLVKNGKVVVAIEEERLDRIKHSEGFIIQGHFERLTKVLPMKAITYCLEAVGIGLDDLDLVVGNRPLNDGAVQRIARELPIKDKSKIRALPMPSHHLTHAYAAYFCSPFNDAAILIVDGIGSRIPDTTRIEKHTMLVGEGDAIRVVARASSAEDLSDMGLGMFYSYISAKLNFITRYGSPTFGDFECGGYTEGGKTMGLAPYGNPRPDWGQVLHYDGDEVRVSRSELDEHWQRWSAAEGKDYDAKVRNSWQHHFAKDVARKAQDETEEAMVYLARRLREKTGKRNLCVSGGVALNSVANQRIAVEAGYDGLYILPAAGDAGIAIGCAMYGYHQLLGGGERAHLETAAVGRTYGEAEVLSALQSRAARLEWRKADVKEVATLLASHHVVGWVQGGSEIGPRALGHRSMLADPRHPEMRDYLNTVVKHREVFRPYAPSVLTEHANEWFVMPCDSPFMLLVPPVRDEKKALVPSITHVDGTARVQTVKAHTNPRYHQMIQHFHKLTGVPLVLNTSYNDAGEPIVETPDDALRTFLNCELDYLYIGEFLVSKRDREVPSEHPRHRPVA